LDKSTLAENAQPNSAVFPVKPAPQKDTSLVTNLAWRAAANWSSQLVSWASLLVVVRLLSPSDFGMVGMSIVLYWYLKFIGGFGITPTVIRHRDYTDDILAQLNTMGVFFGVSSFLLACLLAWPAARFFKNSSVVPVAIVTCIALIPLGVRSVPEGLMNTDMSFKWLSLFDALRDILSAVITISLAWLGFRYWALVLGNLFAETARTIFIVAVRPYRFARPRVSTMRAPLIFGWRVLVSGFAWSTYNTLDNVTAGRVLGQSALGLYGMAWNLANLPLEKITSLVTTLVPSYLSRVQNDMGALRHYLRALTEMIALTTFPVMIGLVLVASEAVPVVLGPKWNGMVAPLQVLCFYGALRSVVALLPKVLTAVGNARYVMRVEVLGLFLMPLAFWIGSHWGIKGIAFGWVFAYPVIAIAEYWKTLKTIGMQAADYIGALRPAVDGCIAMAVAVLILQRLLLQRPVLQGLAPSSHYAWVGLLLQIAVGAVVYTATVLLLHRGRAIHFLNIAKRMRGPKLQPKAGVA
jgi:O-antigen/teichoic acid export membrane protein